MKIGIISDIHNHLDNIKRAVDYLNKNNVGLVIHCGDWASPLVVKAFADLKAPLKGVLGNMDMALNEYNYKIKKEWNDLKLDIEISEGSLEIEIEGKKIAVTHGNNEKLKSRLIESQKYDLICLGHTHEPLIEERGSVLIVNPGSLAGYKGLNQTPMPPTIAIYDTDTDKTKIVEIT